METPTTAHPTDRFTAQLERISGHSQRGIVTPEEAGTMVAEAVNTYRAACAQHVGMVEVRGMYVSTSHAALIDRANAAIDAHG